MNLSPSEMQAIDKIEQNSVEAGIRNALKNETCTELRSLLNFDCGSYIRNHLERFEKAVLDLKRAKSAKKREETYQRAHIAGIELSTSVSTMKSRRKQEEADGQFFYVDDNILWPNHFSEHLNVSVSYRWRKAPQEEWSHGRTEFHWKSTARRRVEYEYPRKTKLSKSKQAQLLDEERSRDWRHLKDLALSSLRDYFRSGGDGNKIPSTFEAIPDRYSNGLNNFSCKFWQKPAD